MTPLEGYKLAQSGDFDALYKAHHHTVHAAAFKFTHDKSAADDLAQDVWLKVHRFLHTFNGCSTFKTWVYEITFREFLQGKRPADTLKRNNVSEVSLEFLREHLWDRGEYDQRLMTTPMRLDLTTAIDNLPKSQREAVYGFVEGRLQREHGVARCTVSVRLMKAKATLRKELSK